MKLSDADRQKIADWIQSKCGQLRCVCCGTARWTLLDFSTLPIGIDLHTTRFHYHAGLPQVTIACEHCAHLVSFSAAMIGFKPDEPVDARPTGS